MKYSNWSNKDIPNQKDRTIIITGASSGLGKEAAKVLSSKNATVILAVRNVQKAETVAEEIRSDFPNAKLDIRSLDLGSLDSVKAFSKGILSDYNNLDVLINNAGVMMCPYSKTKDGFEIQMGTNHLGHFALTGLLMPLLERTKDSRVVATSSIAHKTGRINLDDLNWESRKYNTTKAYSDSKLANLYFIYELQARLKGKENAPIITASHPGWTKTELDRHSGLASFIGNIIAQTPKMGTLPTLRAATDIHVKSGDYYGPEGFMEMRGYPVKVDANKLAQDKGIANKLWNLSEQLTGVNY
ncbi:MAG: NAD(P)-dependent dehydrogenase (short-subunit alcohol dehydrogenase family) [Algoriphagus sp.]|jgi:NAD(P)-dependent dehydrogenase (short-subunit alcohol dehydrogenase family)